MSRNDERDISEFDWEKANENHQCNPSRFQTRKSVTLPDRCDHCHDRGVLPSVVRITISSQSCSEDRLAKAKPAGREIRSVKFPTSSRWNSLATWK